MVCDGTVRLLIFDLGGMVGARAFAERFPTGTVLYMAPGSTIHDVIRAVTGADAFPDTAPASSDACSRAGRCDGSCRRLRSPPARVHGPVESPEVPDGADGRGGKDHPRRVR